LGFDSNSIWSVAVEELFQAIEKGEVTGWKIEIHWRADAAKIDRLELGCAADSNDPVSSDTSAWVDAENDCRMIGLRRHERDLYSIKYFNQIQFYDNNIGISYLRVYKIPSPLVFFLFLRIRDCPRTQVNS
jgi:hypothetical protein